MNFEIRKISNYGASHPVVARLMMQTGELIQFSNLPKEDKDKVQGFYFELHNRLLKCHDIYDRLMKATDEAVKRPVPPQTNKQIKEVPHVIGLNGEAESYLYEAKNYLRDTLSSLKIFFGRDFPDKINEASSYYDPKGTGKSALALWAEKKFGADDPLSEMFRGEQKWTGDIVRMRNAVEHPGEKSGTLIIKNIVATEKGLEPPLWNREGEPPSNLLVDMEMGLENMLTLGEELLIQCIQKRMAPNNVMEFVEIPIEARRQEAPQRFTVQIKAEIREKMFGAHPNKDPK